jgi:hypothetical protein
MTFEYTFSCHDPPKEGLRKALMVKGEVCIRQVETNSIKVNKFCIIKVSNRKSILYFTHINNIKIARGKEYICRADCNKDGEWQISAPQSPSWNIMRLCWTSSTGMMELGLLSTTFAQDIVVGFVRKQDKYQLYLNTLTKEFLSERDEVLLHAKPVEKPQETAQSDGGVIHDGHEVEEDDSDFENQDDGASDRMEETEMTTSKLDA